MQRVLPPGHPSASSVTPSRDMHGNFGLGTARREEANLTPAKSMRIKLAGRTQPQWAQSRAVENRGGILPPSRGVHVLARSGNQDPTAVGLSRRGLWATAGVGADPAPAVVPTTKVLLLLAAGYAAWKMLGH